MGLWVSVVGVGTVHWRNTGGELCTVLSVSAFAYTVEQTRMVTWSTAQGHTDENDVLVVY